MGSAASTRRREDGANSAAPPSPPWVVHLSHRGMFCCLLRLRLPQLRRGGAMPRAPGSRAGRRGGAVVPSRRCPPTGGSRLISATRSRVVTRSLLPMVAALAPPLEGYLPPYS